jgi:iron complex transport system substrate-binding protein
MRRSLRQLILFIFIALGPMLLPACAIIPMTPSESQTGGGLVAEDALGRTVILERAPQRIVIAGRANFMLNNAAYLFPEAQERVVALTKAKQNTGFLKLIDPNAEEKLLFHSESSAEELATANPDLVLLKSFMADGVGSTLEALDIPVVYLQLETPEQYRRDIGVLGTLFQNEVRAAEIIAFYDDRLARIRTTLEDEEPASPSALVLQHDSRGEDVAFQVPPTSWIQTWMIEFVGATPVWASEATGGWTVVNLEQIAAWDPAHIYVIDYFANVEETVATLESAPLWEPLTAVQQGHVHGFPKDYYSWDQPDVRWILGVTWMAKQTHPKLFAKIDMREEVHDFYETLYGLDAETVEEVIIPRIQGDLN